MRHEVTDYLKAKRSDQKEDVLTFWKNNRNKWPSLADMAKKYHSAPPSSAAPERLFSTAKHVLKPTRLAMKPQKVEASIFMKKNLASSTSAEFEAAPEAFVEPNLLECSSYVMGSEPNCRTVGH